MTAGEVPSDESIEWGVCILCVYFFLLTSTRQQLRLDAQFIHRRNQTADVVVQDLAKCLILHRDLRFGANRVSKLAFHHAERGFDVRPFAVSLQELFAVQAEEVERLAKQPT